MRLNDLEISALENNGSSRPMKANSPASAMRLNIIVSTGARKAASAHLEFIKSCIEAIGADWDKARSAAKPTKSPTTHDCCHDDAGQLIDGTKEFTGLSIKVDQDINQAAESLFQDLFGVSALDLGAETIIGKTLAQVINESIQDGFEQAEKEWKKRAAKEKEWAASNPFPDAAIEPTPEMGWLRNIYNDGFTRVKNKVFQQLTPLVKRTIAQGVAAGKTMQQIAEELYSQHGSGYLWQWQRLIRTESHNAAFQANLEEYRDCGAIAVRWSAALNPCNVCQAIQSRNQGYYPIESVPRPPHPNCRCHTTPVFSLPFGIVV